MTGSQPLRRPGASLRHGSAGGGGRGLPSLHPSLQAALGKGLPLLLSPLRSSHPSLSSLLCEMGLGGTCLMGCGEDSRSSGLGVTAQCGRRGLTPRAHSWLCGFIHPTAARAAEDTAQAGVTLGSKGQEQGLRVSVRKPGWPVAQQVGTKAGAWRSISSLSRVNSQPQPSPGYKGSIGPVAGGAQLQEPAQAQASRAAQPFRVRSWEKLASDTPKTRTPKAACGLMVAPPSCRAPRPGPGS